MKLLAELAERLELLDEDGPEYKLVMRQMNGVRRNSRLGSLLMQEYDADGMRAVRHWYSS